MHRACWYDQAAGCIVNYGVYKKTTLKGFYNIVSLLSGIVTRIQLQFNVLFLFETVSKVFLELFDYFMHI